MVTWSLRNHKTHRFHTEPPVPPASAGDDMEL